MKISIVTLILLCLALCSSPNATEPNRPNFITKELNNFEANYGCTEWAIPFGWGIGCFDLDDSSSIDFYWFVGSHQDANLEIYINEPLPKEIINSLRSNLQWQVNTVQNYPSGEFVATSIRTGSTWKEKFCKTDNNTRVCEFKLALQALLDQLEKHELILTTNEHLQK